MRPCPHVLPQTNGIAPHTCGHVGRGAGGSRDTPAPVSCTPALLLVPRFAMTIANEEAETLAKIATNWAPRPRARLRGPRGSASSLLPSPQACRGHQAVHTSCQLHPSRSRIAEAKGGRAPRSATRHSP